MRWAEFGQKYPEDNHFHLLLIVLAAYGVVHVFIQFVR